ncbi:MAG TPA: hypothetical protein VM580_32290, partial [Labilithrix sp.]|nr:hypothetical protein [Labilithrix sp.]
MVRGRSGSALAALVIAGHAIVGAAWGCGPRNPRSRAVVRPREGAPRLVVDGGADAGPTYSDTAAAPTTPKPVPSSMITHGQRAAEFSRQPLPPTTPECSKEERKALYFDHPPTYTEKVEKGGTFSARFFVGNTAKCSRKIAIPLSFTPPKTTNTRTVDFAAYVPPRGAFVEIKLDATELDEADVRPGRYAITFAVFDEENAPVGKALSGNPFRLGRDDVAIVSAPKIPAKIGVGEELEVPLTVVNVGDTANKVTPLIVFTRPGETAGIEHYDPAVLAIPGTSTITIRLSQKE